MSEGTFTLISKLLASIGWALLAVVLLDSTPTEWWVFAVLVFGAALNTLNVLGRDR